MITGDLMGKKKTSRKNKPIHKAIHKAKKAKKTKKAKIKQKKYRVMHAVKAKKGKKKLKTTAGMKKTSTKMKKEICLKIEKKNEEIMPVIEMLKRPDVRKLFIDTGGENAMEIVRLLTQYGKDEEIAEKLGVKVSDVRSVLNKFQNEGIAGYDRTKDEETGWYYYNWSLNIEKLNDWIHKRMNAGRESILAKAQEGGHYFCPNCNDVAMLMRFEEAMDYGFRCPRCNTSMELLDENKVDKLIKNEDSRDQRLSRSSK